MYINIMEKYDMANMVLYQNGRTDYTILISKNADKFDILASAEFNRIAEMSVKTNNLRIVRDDEYDPSKKYISIGDTCLFKQTKINLDKIDFNNDGFLIKTVGQNVVINAKVSQGKLFGVYEFCEKVFGYRCYAPDEEKFIVTKEVSMPTFNVIQKPTFAGRACFTYLADATDVSRYRAALRQNNYATGPQFLYAGENFWSVLNDQSTVFQILNFDKYYDAHPDWYYIGNGKTKKEYDETYDDFEWNYQGNSWTFLKENVQLCYSKMLYSKGEKGGAYQTFLDNLINNYIVKEQDKQFFMIGIMDNDQICQCPDCKRDVEKYTYTGVILRFVNEIAKDVEAWRKANCPQRKVYLVLFAYFSTEFAPAVLKGDKYVPIDPSVVPEDNIVIRWAPITADYYRTLDDPDNVTAGNDNVKPSKMLKMWTPLTKNFAIWDYRVNFGSIICPYPVWKSLKKNLLIYKDINVIDIFAQGPSRMSNTSLHALDDYCRARLMWNINLSYKALYNDFIENYYKQAGKYIKQYINAFMKNYQGMIEKKIPLHVSDSVVKKEFWSKEVLLKLERILDKAYQSIQFREQDELVYEKLKGRIDMEAQFPKFMLLELYGDTFTKSKVKARINEFANLKKLNRIKSKEIWHYIDDWKEKYLK